MPALPLYSGVRRFDAMADHLLDACPLALLSTSSSQNARPVHYDEKTLQPASYVDIDPDEEWGIWPVKTFRVVRHN